LAFVVLKIIVAQKELQSKYKYKLFKNIIYILKMIKLDDLFRLTVDVPPQTTIEEPDSDCRYTPYKIFILETRLYPMIYDMFRENISIYPKSIYNSEKNRMDVYLKIVKLEKVEDEEEDEPIDLTKEEKELIEKKIIQINTENIDFALINIYELYKSFYFEEKFSFSWFRSVLEYVGLNNDYLPFIKEEGIYLSFNRNSDYKKAYYDVCKFIVDKIEDFYERGVIVLGNIIDSEKKEKLIENWGLIHLDEDNRLFEPDWEDKRFAPNMVNFLTLKIEENPYIQFLLPDNLVKRHGIIKAMQEDKKAVIVEGSYLKVEVENLEEARKVAALFTAAKTTTLGRVMIIAGSRLSEIYLYFDYAKKFKKGECVTYQVNDNKNPYIFSCLLKEDNYEATEALREKFRNYALNRLIEVSKITKLKNMSPHDIIEQEYS
jgi:hypothetical protein